MNEDQEFWYCTECTEKIRSGWSVAHGYIKTGLKYCNYQCKFHGTEIADRPSNAVRHEVVPYSSITDRINAIRQHGKEHKNLSTSIASMQDYNCNASENPGWPDSKNFEPPTRDEIVQSQNYEVAFEQLTNKLRQAMIIEDPLARTIATTEITDPACCPHCGK
jgi:hypothetical protein